MEEKTFAENIASSDRKTQVFLIGSIHYRLATNPRYTMQYLKDYIRSIDPDVIGLEITEEHMQCGYEELNRLYPPEFPEIKKAFEGTKKILPFNWMTRENIEDRAGFLANNKKMRQELAAAPFKQGEKAFHSMLVKAIDTVIDQGSAADVNSIAWDQLVCLKQQFELSIIEGTEFEEKWLYFSGDMNRTRSAAIDNNIKKIIEDNPGKKIVILAGATHRSHIVPFIRKSLPDIDFITEIRGGG